MKFNFFKWFGEFITKYMDESTMEELDDKHVKSVKCALVIGHKQTSQGAYNKTYDIHEFEFNEELAKAIERKLSIVDITVDIFRIYRRTYSSLPSDINELDPDFIISLHCNAFNKQTSGSEVLYYHGSADGKRYANILQEKFVHYLELSDRGIRSKTSEDRGGYLLKNTNAPCIISEPFFIDNDRDYKTVVVEKYNELIKAYQESITQISSIIRNNKK